MNDVTLARRLRTDYLSATEIIKDLKKYGKRQLQLVNEANKPLSNNFLLHFIRNTNGVLLNLNDVQATRQRINENNPELTERQKNLLQYTTLKNQFKERLREGYQNSLIRYEDRGLLADIYGYRRKHFALFNVNTLDKYCRAYEKIRAETEFKTPTIIFNVLDDDGTVLYTIPVTLSNGKIDGGQGLKAFILHFLDNNEGEEYMVDVQGQEVGSDPLEKANGHNVELNMTYILMGRLVRELAARVNKQTNKKVEFTFCKIHDATITDGDCLVDNLHHQLRNKDGHIKVGTKEKKYAGNTYEEIVTEGKGYYLTQEDIDIYFTKTKEEKQKNYLDIDRLIVFCDAKKISYVVYWDHPNDNITDYEECRKLYLNGDKNIFKHIGPCNEVFYGNTTRSLRVLQQKKYSSYTLKPLEFVYKDNHIVCLQYVDETVYHSANGCYYKFKKERDEEGNEKAIFKKVEERKNIISNQTDSIKRAFDKYKFSESSEEFVTLLKTIEFDFETIFNHITGRLTPYSVSILVKTQKYINTDSKDDSVEDMVANLKKYEKLDGYRKVDGREYYMEQTAFGFSNSDIAKFMAKIITQESIRSRVILKGFNIAKFDNYFLLDILKEMDILNSVMFNKNEILRMKFGGCNNVHDLQKFIVSNLKAACENFNTKFRKNAGEVDEFSHTDVQDSFLLNGNAHDFFHEIDCPHKQQEFYEGYYYTIATENNKHYDGKDIGVRKKIEKLTKQTTDLFYNITSPEALDTIIKNHLLKCKCKKFQSLVRYNLYDVFASDDLYWKVEKVLQPHFQNGKIFSDYSTIGGHILELFEKKVKYEKQKDNKDEIIENIEDTEVKEKTKKIKNEKVLIPLSDEKLKIILPLLNKECYKIVQQSQLAGRTQAFKKCYHDVSNDDLYVMIDVKSLYPYICLNRLYPCGEIIMGTYEECMNKKLIGFFPCTFNQKNLKKKIIPYRFRKCTIKHTKDEKEKCESCIFNKVYVKTNGINLNWEYEGEITTCLSTIDIKCLQDYGVDVTCKSGFYFSEVVEGKKLFACIGEFKKIKEEQDVCKKYHGFSTKYLKDGVLINEIAECDKEMMTKFISNSDKFMINSNNYNPAVRELAKLYINALTGKVGQRLILEKTAFIKNNNEADELRKQYTNVESIHQFTDGAGFVKYEVSEDEAMKQSNMPIYLNTVIYSYARDYMYRSVIFDYDGAYMDTDSMLMKFSEVKKMFSQKRELFGCDFGQFEFEEKLGAVLVNGELNCISKCNEIITLAPKNYFCLHNDNGKIEILKKGFKGVNLKSDKVITQNEIINFINERDIEVRIYKTTGKGENKITKDVISNCDEFVEHYNKKGITQNKDWPASITQDLMTFLTIGEMHELYTKYLSSKTLNEDQNKILFINEMGSKKYCSVMCSSLLKVKKDNKDGTQKFGIYQRYMIKKITCDGFEKQVK